MPTAGFEPPSAAIKRLQTYTLDRTATGFILPKSYQSNDISYKI